MDPLLNKVVLYCSFDEPPAPTAGQMDIPAALGANQIMRMNLPVTGNPAASRDISNKKYGTGSLACEFVAHTRLIEPNVTIGSLSTATPKLTVEAWVYRKNASATVMFGKSGRSNISYTNWQIVIQPTGGFYGGFGISGTPGSSLGSIAAAAGSLPVGQWTHLAMVVDGTSVKLYANGVQVGSGTLAQQPQDNNPMPFYIGTELDQASQSSTGCLLDDLRITADVRYTGPFTPEDYSGNYPLPPSNGLTGQLAAITAIPANQEPRAVFQPQDVAWRGTPPLFPGPVSRQPVTDVLLCQPGLDLFLTRDGMQIPQGYIESTVTISGEGVRRRVLCFDQAGNLVGETWSRASDGKYRFDRLWLNRRYMLVAQDDPAFGPADYNAVAADFQQPTPYAPGEGVGLTGG